MKKEKLILDTQTLQRFIQFHCEREHNDTPKKEGSLQMYWEEKPLCVISYCVCEECEALFVYGYNRLQNCPHEPKPSCRKCPTPCYEKPVWKKMAKVMMYSGMRLGLSKVRNILFK